MWPLESPIHASERGACVASNQLTHAGAPSAIKVADPHPCTPRCKLVTISPPGHCVSMCYVVFPVCKGAREFCKLGFRPKRDSIHHVSGDSLCNEKASTWPS